MKIEIKILIGISLFFILIAGILIVVKSAQLRFAHKTFENYSTFRGCVEIVNKTDSYGYCKLNSGVIIKLVRYQEKWFLDGDFPVSCGFFTCP